MREEDGANCIFVDEKYKDLFIHCLNYQEDAVHYFSKKDYFSAMGCANYAYGILEAILFIEKGIVKYVGP